MGPPAKIVLRLCLYATLTLLAVSILWFTTTDQGPKTVVQSIQTVPFLIALFAFHAFAAVLCFRIRNADRHDLAWMVAMVPAPAVWALLAEATASPDIAGGKTQREILVCAVGAVWVAAMALRLFRTRRIQMGVEELDYVVSFAGWINCFGAGLVVLAISPSALESFQTAARGFLR